MQSVPLGQPGVVKAMPKWAAGALAGLTSAVTFALVALPFLPIGAAKKAALDMALHGLLDLLHEVQA